jgi:hypothetical protein
MSTPSWKLIVVFGLMAVVAAVIWLPRLGSTPVRGGVLQRPGAPVLFTFNPEVTLEELILRELDPTAVSADDPGEIVWHIVTRDDPERPTQRDATFRYGRPPRGMTAAEGMPRVGPALRPGGLYRVEVVAEEGQTRFEFTAK